MMDGLIDHTSGGVLSTGRDVCWVCVCVSVMNE